MSSELITELDENFGNDSVDTVYPHITVDATNKEALPLVISLLEEGTLPVYFAQDGETYELARIAYEPLNLLKLLRVYKFRLAKNVENIVNVTDNISLMEACK